MDLKALHLQVKETRQSFFDEVSLFQTNEHINVIDYLAKISTPVVYFILVLVFIKKMISHIK